VDGEPEFGGDGREGEEVRRQRTETGGKKDMKGIWYAIELLQYSLCNYIELDL